MPPAQPKASFHALVTGAGPFLNVPINPSWTAIVPLHDTIIRTPSTSIHVTVIGPIKVSYSSVLSLVQDLHARPPRLPSSDSEVLDGSLPTPTIPPPPNGYDFVCHLGVGYPGEFSLEQVGHKSGYKAPGVDGKLPPVISTTKNAPVPYTPSAAEQAEAARVGHSFMTHNADAYVKRGFAKGYEKFPEELHTEVDVHGLIRHLKAQGETRVHASTDAGYYLCDFTCYGSLAESQRSLFYPSTSSKNSRRSPTLFMHVPSKDEPHTIEEMTEAVRQIVAWVCTKEKALP